MLTKPYPGLLLAALFLGQAGDGMRSFLSRDLVHFTLPRQGLGAANICYCFLFILLNLQLKFSALEWCQSSSCVGWDVSRGGKTRGS